MICKGENFKNYYNNQQTSDKRIGGTQKYRESENIDDDFIEKLILSNVKKIECLKDRYTALYLNSQ